MNKLLTILAEGTTTVPGGTTTVPGGTTTTPDPIGQGGDLSSSIIGVLNGIISILGIVAVVVIIIGGIGYMTSAGDAGKVKKAKDTILYGVIGLIIVVLSFAIVNFVISNVIGGTNS